MSTNKRFYWLKLKEDFFETDEIEYLLNQKDGEKMVILYLRMCTKTLNTDGELVTKIGDKKQVKMTAKTVKKLTGFSEKFIQKSFEIFEEIGLMDFSECENGKMLRVLDMTGSESESAERKRRQREHENVGIERDIERDIVPLENRDIDIRDIISPLTPQTSVQKFGSEECDEDDEDTQKSFDRFWELYPKKRNKAKAFECWLMINPKDRQSVFDGLSNWKASESWKAECGRYVPSADKFLADERYKQEFVTSFGDKSYATGNSSTPSYDLDAAMREGFEDLDPTKTKRNSA